jgi:hypothetical protein
MSDNLVVCDAARSWNYFFRGQAIHLLFLAAMLPAAWALAVPANDEKLWCGFTNLQWFGMSVAAAIAHQVFVWLGWRSQLCWQTLTVLFGRNDFSVFCAIFFPLLVARPVLVFTVGWVDRGSLALPTWVSFSCGFVLLLPSLMAGYSVMKYFGVARAAGGDHFREQYRQMPLVRKGAFRWTNNAMYTLVFFGLWSIAFLLQSHLALVAAIFQHGYIWVHYLGTEQPDMDLLYALKVESQKQG